MVTVYRGLKLDVFEDVYEPAEDTFLLAENIDVTDGDKVLEIGTGCGLISILAARAGGEVTATDVNENAIKCARKNAKENGLQDRIDFKSGNLFGPVGEESYDKILFNPPYLPVPEDETTNSLIERAWDGGPDGRNTIDRFLEEVENHLNPGGSFLFLQSSLSGLEETLDKLERKGFHYEKKSKKTSFEMLYLFKVRTDT